MKTQCLSRIGVLMMVGSLGAAGEAQSDAGASPMKAETLRCEYLATPLGIDTTAPRLSWILTSARRDEVQKARQVLVASSADLLNQDKGDLWDSGKVVGADTNQVVYQGKPLQSAQRCWWKVRSWDKNEAQTAWSEPSFWEMGLLQPADWKAKWIGTDDKILPVVGLEGASWISAGDNTSSSGTLVFRKEISGQPNSKALRALVRFASDKPLRIYWNGKQIGRTSGDWQNLEVFDPGNSLQPQGNMLAVRMEEAISSASLIAHIDGMWDFGGPFRIHSDSTWMCRSGDVSDADLASTSTEGWTAAQEVCKWGEGEHKLSPIADSRVNAHPAPLFRREFDLSSNIRSARLRVCGLGYQDVYINGQRVGDHFLDPAYTNYSKRVLYVTHDVTPLLKKGSNAVGVMLGTGWFDTHTLVVWDFEVAPWRATPRVLLQLEAELEDGSQVVIGSDGKWKRGTGPIQFDSIYEGETYDARKEVPGWSTAGFDDSSWQAATEQQAPAGQLRAQQLQPIRALKTLEPAHVTEPRPGVYLFDFGQNLTGFPQLTIEGDAGTSIVMTCGERLKPDGSLELHPINGFTIQRDARQRFQQNIYILKGGGREVYEPRFTYQGFQYVEVTGSPKPLTGANLRARVTHTDVPPAGEFNCSNDLFNRIQQNTVWSYLSNLMGIPTDCPHREKNGWTGDAQLAWQMGNYNFDGAAFYTKWLHDLADAQQADGGLPGIVPSSGWGYGFLNGPAWDSAYVLIPWYMFEFYGDKRVLEEHFDGMKKYVDWVTGRAENGIVSYGLGDWCPADTRTSASVTSTAFYYRDARIVSHAASLLNRKDDADKYEQLANQIRDAFNREFLNRGTGLYSNGSQTALGCALYEGLAPEDQHERVVENLLKAVQAKNNHLDTGILGAKYVPNALLDAGHADVVYAMFSQRTQPGYGWWIEQGATTLWEQWNGDDSRNHIMFGDISAWFYKALGGIRNTGHGWRKFAIHPSFVDGLTSVSAHYDSINGRIASSWKIDRKMLELNIEVPANTRAEVYLPVDAKQVTEGSTPVTKAEGVHVFPSSGPFLCEVGSGKYTFRMPRPQ